MVIFPGLMKPEAKVEVDLTTGSRDNTEHSALDEILSTEPVEVTPKLSRIVEEKRQKENEV